MSGTYHVLSVGKRGFEIVMKADGICTWVDSAKTYETAVKKRDRWQAKERKAAELAERLRQRASQS